MVKIIRIFVEDPVATNLLFQSHSIGKSPLWDSFERVEFIDSTTRGNRSQAELGAEVQAGV